MDPLSWRRRAAKPFVASNTAWKIERRTNSSSQYRRTLGVGAPRNELGPQPPGQPDRLLHGGDGLRRLRDPAVVEDLPAMSDSRSVSPSWRFWCRSRSLTGCMASAKDATARRKRCPIWLNNAGDGNG
jgi:hypothetical protein